MTEPIDQKEIANAASEIGLFAVLRDMASSGSLERGPDFVSTIASMINQRQVAFHNERDAITVKELKGRVFWDLQIFLCDLIPQIDVPSATLMPLTEALVEKGGDDGMSNQPNAAFRKWCAADLQRSAEVLAAARRGESLAARHLGLALEASGDVLGALKVLAEEHGFEVHLGAITALGRIELHEELAETAASEVAQYAADHAHETVRNNALISTFAILGKHPELGRVPAAAALTQATNSPSDNTLHAIATVLWLHGGSMTEGEVTAAFKALENVDPDHTGTISRVDMATAKLVDAGRIDHVSGFVKAYAKRTKNGDALEDFSCLRSELLKNKGYLARTVVDWFLDGDVSLCASLASMLMGAHDEPTELSLTPVDLPTDPEEQLILCRRVVGHLFQSPVTAASVIVSVLEYGDLNCAEELKGLLLDPLLFSYGGTLRGYLEEVRERLLGAGGEVLTTCLDTKAEMLEQMEGIECLKELHPSESQRQLERVRWHRHMEEAVHEGMKNSVLLHLVTTQTLLYGTKSSSYIADPCGELRKVGMSMGEHSVMQEYPQLDIFDPEGLQLRLLALKIGRGASA